MISRQPVRLNGAEQRVGARCVGYGEMAREKAGSGSAQERRDLTGTVAPWAAVGRGSGYGKRLTRRRGQKAAMGLFYRWEPDPAHNVAATPGTRS